MNMYAREKERYNEIDILRGIAILMVLLYHSIIVYPVNLHETAWCAGLHRLLWTVQMPLFFFVSGFCFSTKKGLKAYYSGRIMRILVPHVVFSLLDILPRIIPNPFVNQSGDSGVTLLKDFFFYGGNDWFLLTLFIAAALFPAVEMLIGQSSVRLGIAFVVSGILYVFHDKITDLFCFNLVCGFFIYFLAGYCARKYTDTHRIPRGKGWQGDMPKSAGLMLLSAVLYALYLKSSLRVLELAFVLAAGAFWLLAASNIRGAAASFIKLCGKWSLQLYLLDPYAVVFTRTVLGMLLGIRNPVIIILFNYIPDILLTLFGSVFVLGKIRLLGILSGVPGDKINKGF